MKQSLIRDIRNLFEQEKEDCYKPVKNSINKSFISSKDTDEERVMHLQIKDIEFMIYDVIEELFESLHNRY